MNPPSQKPVAHTGQITPEFVALPARGGDPVCGLSRSWWYGAERDGLIQLVRLRQPGQVRGRVLLPVKRAVELITRLGERNLRGADVGGLQNLEIGSGNLVVSPGMNRS